MKREVVIKCSTAQYDLYNYLSQYFDVEILNEQDNTLGIMDSVKIFIEPITKTVETLGNIIIAIINANVCNITVKCGDKEIIFKGQVEKFSNEDVINMINKMLEE